MGRFVNAAEACTISACAVSRVDLPDVQQIIVDVLLAPPSREPTCGSRARPEATGDEPILKPLQRRRAAGNGNEQSCQRDDH